MDGIIQARSVADRNGEILLLGNDKGITRVSGILDASGLTSGGTGGTIKVLGNKVGLFDNALLNVSGESGGGTVLIGGNYQGLGSESNTAATYVAKDAVINADAVTNGNGGKVITWADDTTRFYGTISARGGSKGGDGGFAEVSGSFLDYQGYADLRAAAGETGTLLLDPNNITIQAAGPDTNISGAFTSTDDNAILMTGTIVAALGLSNVTISTGTGGANSQDDNIVVNDTITAPATAFGLTMNAHNNITVNANINMTTGTGTVTMNADSDDNGTGTFTVANGSSVTTNNRLITITAADIDLQGQLNAGTISNTKINIYKSTAGTFGLGNTAGDMTLSGAELQNITADDVEGLGLVKN